MADPIFAERRLAEIYDPLDPDRSDLDVYAAIVEEFGARSVLDIGCGTGTFACLLARRGIAVIGVDPAGASLEVARAKPGADRVRWVHGYATDLGTVEVDMVTMTANVAQVFLTDEDWAATLYAARAALRPGGHLVFETRDPAARAWLGWNREASHLHIDGVATWCELACARARWCGGQLDVVVDRHLRQLPVGHLERRLGQRQQRRAIEALQQLEAALAKVAHRPPVHHRQPLGDGGVQRGQADEPHVA